MFRRLFSSPGQDGDRSADSLYGAIVAAARQPVLFSHWLVPDTPLGRFEAIGLHMFLVLRRLHGQGAAAEALAQTLTDTFFTELDHSLRELGIGDIGVPKRMKKLARMYFGRMEAYGAAVDAGDEAALAAALKRNIHPDTPDWPHGPALAAHVMACAAALERQSVDDLLAGRAAFAQPVAQERAP